MLPKLYLMMLVAKSARVMLISNLWVEVGLVNGAVGTIEASATEVEVLQTSHWQ